MTGQLTANGTCMPQYACFDIPGIDWPGRRVSDCLTVLQAASVAHQLGKRQILSESFAMCGWNVSFEELRRIAEYQMVHGVTLLCQHLAPYSLGVFASGMLRLRFLCSSHGGRNTAILTISSAESECFSRWGTSISACLCCIPSNLPGRFMTAVKQAGRKSTGSIVPCVPPFKRWSMRKFPSI